MVADKRTCCSSTTPLVEESAKMKSDDVLTESNTPAAFCPDLTKITGSIASAILLVNLVSWSRSGSSAEIDISKNSEDLESDTGLGKSELQDAINQLKANGFIEEEKVTATSWRFEVNTEVIKSRIEALLDGIDHNEMMISGITEDGIALSSDMVRDAAKATPYYGIDHRALEGFCSLYGLNKVILTIDILAALYREKPDLAGNPTLVLTKALLKGVNPPVGHISYFEKLRAVRIPDILMPGKSVSGHGPDEDESQSPWRGML
jgi:hypothetical protein